MPIANINGVNLNYEVAGQGEAVVFLHGMTGSTQDWANQFPALAPRYRAIALDRRGIANSAAPSREGDYSIEIFASDVFGLSKRLRIRKCCLVGHSIGGIIALQFALRHQERLAALVLVDTSSGELARPPDYAQLRQKLEELARSQGMEAAFEYNLANNPQMRQRFQEHPEQKEAMRQRMLTFSVDGYIYTERAGAKWQPVTPRLSEIKVPTLIFCGEEGLMFVQAVKSLKKGIADSELVTVKGAGHSPHEEAPDFFNETLLKFLDRINW